MVRLHTTLGMRLVAVPLGLAALGAGVCSAPSSMCAYADEAPAALAEAVSADASQLAQSDSSPDVAVVVSPEDVDVCLAGQTAVGESYALVGSAGLPDSLREAGFDIACAVCPGQTYDVSGLASLKTAYVCVPEIPSSQLAGSASASADVAASDASTTAAQQEPSEDPLTDADSAPDAGLAALPATLLGADGQALRMAGALYGASAFASDGTFENLGPASEGAFAFEGGAVSGDGSDQAADGETGPGTAAASVNAHLVARVALEGADLSEGQFSFRAEPLDGAPALEGDVAVNAADGTVDFGEVAFSAPGDYTYRLTQTPGDLASVVYDDAAADVTFHVGVDEATGALVAEQSEPPTFSNRQTVSADDAEQAVAPVTVDLSTRVSLSGADLNAGAFQFKITLIDGAPEPASTMAVNAQDGTVDFGAATFSKPGTYTYSVVQVPGDAEGMTYDDSTLTFTVKVSRVASQQGLAADVSVSSKEGFANSYKALQPSEPAQPASGDSQGEGSGGSYSAAAAIVTASVSQASGKPVAGSVSLDIVDDTGTVVASGTNDANGTVRFAALQLSQPGEYSYTVRPSEGAALSQVASTDEVPTYRVDVKVEDTGTGLLANVSYPDGRPTFTASSAPAKERLATSGSAATLDASDDLAKDPQPQSAFSPVTVVVAAVVAVALAGAVAAVVLLQKKGSKKPAHTRPSKH